MGNFDVGKDIVQNDNECHHFLLYQKCINSIVDKSKCDSKVKDIAIGYLESRVKIADNICKTVVKKFKETDKEERILVESEMQSAVDGMSLKINFFVKSLKKLFFLSFSSFLNSNSGNSVQAKGETTYACLHESVSEKDR